MRVITLCGSLHSGSTNRAILTVVAQRLEELGIDVDSVDVTGGVPAFQPQLVDDPPSAVQRLRAQFEGANGIVVAVPEYAGGAPGWVKNVTDWMVGSAALHGRAAAVLSASTSGGANAIEQLARTLAWQGALVVSTCRVPAPLTKVSDDLTVTDEMTVAELTAVADALAAALASEQADVQVATIETLAELGVELRPGGAGG